MPRPTNKQADAAFESMLRRMESIIGRKLNQNFNQLSRDIQRAMESYDIAGAEAVVSLNDIVLQQILLEAYEMGNRQGAKMVARDIEEDESLIEESVLLALLLWRTDTALRVAKEINRTTRKVYDKVLAEVASDLTEVDKTGRIVKPPTQGQISKEVAKRTNQRNKKRSGTIATTESQRGIQNGSAEGANIAQDQLVKIWRSQQDRKVRPTHRRADGQQQPLDGLFNVGRGKGRFPLDDMLPSSETIGCRCYTRFKKIKA